MMHKKAVHPKPIKDTDLEEEDNTGKRKIYSIVDRLANEPKGNTIRTTAGFMVVAKDGEHDEELPEDPYGTLRTGDIEDSDVEDKRLRTGDVEDRRH